MLILPEKSHVPRPGGEKGVNMKMVSQIFARGTRSLDCNKNDEKTDNKHSICHVVEYLSLISSFLKR